MDSPCCCAVKMHFFSQKDYLEQAISPAALKHLNRFAPGTHFSGDFLPEIYHPSLTVSGDKLALIKTLNIKLYSSYSLQNIQQMIDTYARNQQGLRMKLPPPTSVVTFTQSKICGGFTNEIHLRTRVSACRRETKTKSNIKGGNTYGFACIFCRPL